MLSINFNPFPIISTERLLIRQMMLSDASDIYAFRTDERVNKYIDRKPPVSVEAVEKLILKLNEAIEKNESIIWSMEHRADKIVIGTLCLWNIEAETNRAEIGYEMLPSYQGKGYMQEAIIPVIEYGFKGMGLDSISAIIHKDNQKSIVLAERNGFTLDESIKVEDGPDLGCYILRCAT